MSTNPVVFWSLIAGLLGLWLLAEPTPWPGLEGTRLLRGLLLQATGVIGIGLMSVGMLLAARPGKLERPLGGLDRMMQLHRWLGVGGFVMALAHWSTDFLPRRGPKLPRLPLEQMGPVQGTFEAVREVAADAGDWMFKALVLLVALALWKAFPYKRFLQTHRWLAVVYIILVGHAIVLLRFEYWVTPLGAAMAALLGTGTIAAGWVLTGRVGAGRRVPGTLTGITRHDAAGLLDLEIRLGGPWPGHEAGQFAFLGLHVDERPHPFTMTSAWKGDGRLTFSIKALGDYTATLAGRLRPGDAVTVEGPYGAFTFAGDAPCQIWIGAGIGITPFLARLEALAATPDGKAVVLFHPTAVSDEAMAARLVRLATATGVTLHLLWEPRDGRLSAERLTRLVPGWRQADIWFCGPSAFGRTLRQDLRRLGLPAGRFHQEHFTLR